MQATTHALDSMVERGEQQAAAPAAGEPEGRESVRVDAIGPGQYVEGHQIVGEHGPGKGLPEGAGRLGDRVFVKARRPGRTARPRSGSGPAHATAPRTPRAFPRVAGSDATGRTSGCPRRTCRGPARRSPAGPAHWPGRGPNTSRLAGRPPADGIRPRARPTAHRPPTAHHRGSASPGQPGDRRARRPAAATRPWCPARSPPTSATCRMSTRSTVRRPSSTTTGVGGRRRSPRTPPSAVAPALEPSNGAAPRTAAGQSSYPAIGLGCGG